MQKDMEEGFPKLMAYVEENSGKVAGMPLTAYHKVDEKTMHFDCDLAIPIAENIETGDYEIKTIGNGGGYYKTKLKGGYNFLELAWYAAMSHVRMLKQKVDRSRPSLEVYENDPRNLASSNEILTSIYVPIK